MAYIDQTTGRSRRGTAIVLVALLQGAAIVALVNGLTVEWFAPPEQERTIGQLIPLDPPPRPDPKPSDPAPSDARQTWTTTTTTSTDNRLQDATNDFRLPPLDPPGDGTIGDTFERFPPPPDPAPRFTPGLARPKGSPGGWVTANDYPASELRQGNQGVTGFRLTIGADGRVQSCSVTRTSGFAGLDDATCRKLRARGRFEPATDGNGLRVTGEYAGNIRWQIPE